MGKRGVHKLIFAIKYGHKYFSTYRVVLGWYPQHLFQREGVQLDHREAQDDEVDREEALDVGQLVPADAHPRLGRELHREALELALLGRSEGRELA